MTDATPQAALLTDDEIEMLRIQLTTKLASTLAIYGDDAWDQDFARLVEQAVIAKLQATQEPVQAGELPPLPSEAHWEERIKTLMQQTPLPNSMSVYQAFKQLQNEFEREMIAYARAALAARKPLTPLIARQLGEWHEDDGPVMWWAWNGHGWAGEPAWCGQPTDSDWPGYHTHWTPHPQQPAANGIGLEVKT